MNLGEMISLFRNYVNERPYADDINETTVFWRTEDIIEYLNRANVVYNAFINNLDESWNIEATNYTPGATQLEFILPENCQKVKYVECFSSAVDTLGQELFPINIIEKNRMNIGGSRRYYLKNNRVVLINPLSGVSRLTILCLKTPELLRGNADASELPEQAHENIVLDAVVQGLMRDKQGSLSNYWEKRKMKKDQDLSNYLQPRIAQMPNTVLPRSDWETGARGLSYGF